MVVNPGKLEINLTQAATYLNTTRARVQRMIARGELKGRAIPGKEPRSTQWKIDFVSCTEAIEQQK